MYARKELGQATELIHQSSALLLEIESQDPKNQRYLWVLGANQWYAPAARGGGQSIAIETYTKALGGREENSAGKCRSVGPYVGRGRITHESGMVESA